MEGYHPGTVLYSGPNPKTYEAWSQKYLKDLIVKEYQRSGIASSECLLKEAIRQARAKPRESATLIDVVLSPVDSRGTDESFCVNFVLEKVQQQVARELIERDDGRGQWEAGFNGYEFRRTLYAHDGKKVDLMYSAHLRKEVVIKSKECFFVVEANNLLREAFTLAYVEHPHICQLLDICISKEARLKSFNINLVLEKFERDLGEDIRDRRRHDTPYTEIDLLHFLRDVTRGLAHAKSLRIAHRDIKPVNVFISADGQYKLGDFGSAWKKGRGTLVSTAAGTEAYMSPEVQQCLSEPETYRVDAFPADIYSLGVTVLFSMAAQLLPPVFYPVTKEEVSSISDDLLREMVAADPMLRTSLSGGDIRGQLENMLNRDILLGGRLSVIKNSQETLRAIPYSKKLKKLLQKMVTVDPKRRFNLDNVMLEVDDLLTRSALPPVEIPPAVQPSREKQPAPVSAKPAVQQEEQKLPAPARVQPAVQPSREKQPAPVSAKSAVQPSREKLPAPARVQPAAPKISPQDCTQGTLFRLAFGSDNKMDGRLQVLDIGSRAWAPPQSPTLQMEVDYATCYTFATETAVVLCGSSKEPGTSAYRVEFARSPPTVTALPSFPERRVLAGLYVYWEDLLAFGGSSYYDDDDDDDYCGFQLPQESFLSRVAFFSSNNELVVISYSYMFRIDITQLRMAQEEHEKQHIDPTSPVVIKGDSVFWVSLAYCKTATIKAPFEFSFFR